MSVQNNEKGSTMVICSDLLSQSHWQSTIQTSEALKYVPSLCAFYLTHSLWLARHLSPKGRILEASLIIFTAHSIIPAKRLIHDLPQWRPTPPSQGEGEAKQERKAAPSAETYISSVITFMILNYCTELRSILFFQRGRERDHS